MARQNSASINKVKSHNFKIVLLGKSCVGKTSLVIRYCENKFNDDHLSTLQASFLSKKITVNDTIVNLSIWDTAGQEIFHALGPMYYRDSNGAVIVYDVTDPESLRKAKSWIVELKKMLGNTVCLALVANKIDLLADRYSFASNPVAAEAITYAQTLDKSAHYFTSAKLNQGLQEMFFDLTKRMIEYEKKRSRRNSSLTSPQSHRTLRIQDDDEPDDDNDDLTSQSRRCNC